MTDDANRPSDPPRTMTPYEAWDSRPKLTAAKSVDPLAGVARLFPRDAATPRNISEYERERAERDTEPTGPLTEADKTPAQRPFEIRVERELKELRSDVDAIKASSQTTAQHAVDTYELVKAIRRQQQALEIEHKWLPRLAWLAPTLLSLWALLRTYR